jgi:4-amino-4-deoxy-L-arabinose transferase-like glycosyltransferase
LSLPSGQLYTTAAFYTYLVSLSFQWLGVSEFSARLPSVLIGFVFLGFFYFFTEKAFNRNIAILSTMLLLFSPVEIYYSREVRMYSLLQLSYLLQSYFFYRIFFVEKRQQADSKRQGITRFYAKENILTSLMFLVLLGLTTWFSLQLQLLARLFFPSVLLFIILLGIERFFHKRCFNQKSIVFITVGIFVGLVIIGYLSGNLLSDLYYKYVPHRIKWSEWTADKYLLYLKVLRYDTFLLWLLIPLGFLICTYKDCRKAFYFGSLFAVPFIIQSLLPPKHIRYLYHVYPFAYIFIAVAISSFFDRLLQIIQYSHSRWKNTITGLLLLMGISFFTMNMVYAHKASKYYLPPKPHWKETCAIMKERIRLEDIVITDNSIAVNYYLGRVDYVIDESLLDISQYFRHKDAQGNWQDHYTQAAHITSIEDLLNVKASGKRLWILLGHEGSGFEEIDQYIRETAKRIKDGSQDKRIAVYQLN